MQQAPAPEPLPFGVNMVGPVIIAFGTEAQKQQFLPRIANLDDWWCQGFSEPGAGSDLASLKTKAEARRRPLRRQRPEDMDDARAVRRLDLLPGAHRSGAEEAGRHFLPSHRHEDARHHRAPDPDHRRRPRGQRGLLRRRARAGRESASARRTRAGTTPNSCSATSAPASPASASRRRACAASASLQRSTTHRRQAADRATSASARRSPRSRSS